MIYYEKFISFEFFYKNPGYNPDKKNLLAQSFTIQIFRRVLKYYEIITIMYYYKFEI